MSKKKQALPNSPLQLNIYNVGCTIEELHGRLTQQLAANGVPNPSEVALETIKQGCNNAVLSIQTFNSIQISKQPTPVGFNRG